MGIISWVKLLYLKFKQDDLIFRPEHGIVDDMQNPAYYGLKGLLSFDIRTEDNIIIHLWEKHAKNSKPTFIFFHGNTGHLGDVGKPVEDEDHDPQYRIKTVKEILDSDCGIIAVSLRGYGVSQNVPSSEEGFIKDTQAVIKYALNRSKIPNERTILLGESLGASVAIIAGEIMTEMEKPPAMIVTVSAFSSMIAKVIELHPDLQKEHLEKHLVHKFDSGERINKLSKETYLFFAHPKDDDVTDKSHSKTLAKSAKNAGLSVTHKEIKGGHITWSPKSIIKDSLKIYRSHKKA